MTSIGQNLLNVPMGDMIRQMAFAIAEGQHQLDEKSINVAEMMGGLTTVFDEKGNTSFDDSRVFFGYEYMTIREAIAYAAIDDALTGTLTGDVVKLKDIILELANASGSYVENSGGTLVATTEGKTEVDGVSPIDKYDIRVPTRLSMLELGFTPVFYHFVDTIIEVKISISFSRVRDYTRTNTQNNTGRDSSYSRKRSFWGGKSDSNYQSQVTTSQVDASYAAKYSYSAEGSSLLRTKLSPVPPPAILEERIRGLMENEEKRRSAALEQRIAKSET